ncbi:hypothetical protein Zmor_001798 [Zophobas morio]|uniref:CHK kinase-like domain-containing protein n=1 Tax=Zophobas morio TaxID=2755281 RepID=A0AA38MT45_9CUCU|nr:hypothetical protein Zmor_001798 [Zophobas morio]
MFEEKILHCVSLIVRKENLSKYKLQFGEETKKGDGYFAKVIFTTVTGTTVNGEEKIWEFAVKMSTSNEKLRRQTPVKEFFEREIYLYEQIIPSFKNFQEEMKVDKNMLDVIPTCYLAESLQDCEIVVLENLRTHGFSLWDRKIPTTYDYIKLVLQAYAKWHCFSLAMRHKSAATFEKLTENYVHLFPYFILKVGLDNIIYEYYEEILDAWENDTELKENRFSKSDIKNILTNLVSEDPHSSVILHGDCWTNNFMFKVEEKSQRPVGVRIIDLQLSGLGSPVLDLSVFIYACVDVEKHKNVEELLKIYYDFLSENLRQFKCDPSKIFSYDKLLNHWKTFSCYGLILGIFLLKFSLGESDEVPDFVDSANRGKEFLENFYFHIAKEETYFQRIKNNIIHYTANLK